MSEMNCESRSAGFQPALRWMVFFALVIFFLFSLNLRAENVSSAFNDANKLYEQGKYPEAAAGYEKILQSGSVAPQIYFNLGNAFLKAGELGRAIVAYRKAEKLSPRDPDVRSNLQFARNQAGGGAAAPIRRWENWIGRLTLNEWTIATSAAVAIFFLLLATRQWRANWRKSFRGLLVCIGTACVFLLVCFASAIRHEFFERSAVVIVSEAVVRPGPFEESPSAFTLRDGAEVTVIGKKDNWLEIADASERTGWLQEKQVIDLSR